MFDAYLIDPFTRTLTEVRWDGNLQGIYDLTKTDLIDAVRLKDADSIFIDDEGLMKPKDEQEYFVIMDPSDGAIQHFLAGRGLILGTTDHGESVSPTRPIGYYRERLGFVKDKDWAGDVADKLLHSITVTSLKD